LYSNRFIVLTIGLSLILGACQPVIASEDSLVTQAVQDGLIISPDTLVAAQMAFTTVEASDGRLHRISNNSISLHFPVTADLSFENSGGRLSYRNVNAMQFVEAGDILMSVVFDEDALRVEEQQLLLRMEDADRRHAGERVRRRDDIERFRNEIYPGMNEFDIEIHALRLEGMEAEYQYVIHQFQMLRRDQNRQLLEIRERINGEDIVAPFDAVVSWVNSARLNTVIEDWMNMVTLYDYNSFQLITSGTPDVLRHGDTVLVTDRHGVRHETKVVSDPLANSSMRSHQYHFILEPICPDVAADNFHHSGLNAHPSAVDVKGVMIPSGAVHTEDQRRYVYIYEGGVIRKRYVQTGFFYMGTTQILSGIEPGQLVVLH